MIQDMILSQANIHKDIYSLLNIIDIYRTKWRLSFPNHSMSENDTDNS